MGVYVSIGVRFLLNVEALNMVESIGNLSKHRRAPLVVPDDKGGYKLAYVPAISGESFAHAIQENLVNVAKALWKEPPVDEWSLRGEFFKFGDRRHMPENLLKLYDEYSVKASRSKDVREVAELKHLLEKEAVRASIVADVGGFLIAERLSVKRTSPLSVGYVVPVYDAIEATALESQFHVRHVPSETREGEGEEQRGEEEAERARAAQMIYYVEVGSALYGATINIDVSSIGRTRLVKVEDAVEAEERRKRVRAALLAVALTVSELSFGAKRSRFSPIGEVIEVLAAISEPKVFTVSPPHSRGYAEDTARRAAKFVDLLKTVGIDAKVEIMGYRREGSLPEGVRAFETPEGLFAELVKLVEARL